MRKETQPSFASLARTAVEAAESAGQVLARHFGRKLKVREKPGAGLVTDADLAAEQAALRILRRQAPGFGILTEESPPETRPGPGRWILDPLDGTTNFVHRFPMFCVSLAAEWEGRVAVGVIHHPILRETYLAIRGRGARVVRDGRGARLRVSRTRSIRESLLTTGFTYRKDLLQAEMHAFAGLSKVARAIRRPGSAALDLAYTARGVFDGFWERSLAPWDVAAGALLVEEAGGKVTDFLGRAFRVDSAEILASNGSLHSALARAIR